MLEFLSERDEDQVNFSGLSSGRGLRWGGGMGKRFLCAGDGVSHFFCFAFFLLYLVVCFCKTDFFSIHTCMYAFSGFFVAHLDRGFVRF